MLVSRGRSHNLAVCQDTAFTNCLWKMSLKILKTELSMTFGCLDQNRAGALVIRPHPRRILRNNSSRFQSDMRKDLFVMLEMMCLTVALIMEACN